MKRKLVATLLFAAALASQAADCKKGYRTTIVVQYPDGTPAKARVEVELQCGNGGVAEANTDRDGEAVFDHSLDELGPTRITLQGFAVSELPKNACTGPEKNKRCVVKIHI